MLSFRDILLKKNLEKTTITEKHANKIKQYILGQKINKKHHHCLTDKSLFPLMTARFGNI